MSKKFADKSFGLNQIEKYSGAPYKIELLDLKACAESATDKGYDFQLPGKNIYISSEIDLKTVDKYIPNFGSFKVDLQSSSNRINHVNITEAKYKKNIMKTKIRFRK